MSWNYSAKEFIKVYRRFMAWEWYTNVNVKTLFLHCLLRANWKSGEWHGIHFEAGEFITSLPTLSAETGLSIQQVRSALDKLKTTGELTVKLTDNSTGKKLNKNRIISVSNWDKYQKDNSQTNRQTNSQTNRQVTADIRSIRNNKERGKNTRKRDTSLTAEQKAYFEEKMRLIDEGLA